MKRDEKELVEYLLLLVGLLVFFVFLIIFRYETFALKLIAMLSSLFYLVWGIVHHAANNRLTKEVFLEYMFISSMVFLLFYMVLTA
jgi:hypothetical protein